MWNVFKKPGKKGTGVSRSTEKRIRELEEEVGRLSRELKEVRQGMRKTFTRLGLVRYNPFREIGGNQSFSVALLDENLNGVVVTSHYGREANRVYAKPVQGGSSPYALATEEKQAIAQAVNGGSSHEKARSKP